MECTQRLKSQESKKRKRHDIPYQERDEVCQSSETPLYTLGTSANTFSDGDNMAHYNSSKAIEVITNASKHGRTLNFTRQNRDLGDREF